MGLVLTTLGYGVAFNQLLYGASKKPDPSPEGTPVVDWVAVGYDNNDSKNLLYSTDGISWEPSKNGVCFG